MCSLPCAGKMGPVTPHSRLALLRSGASIFQSHRTSWGRMSSLNLLMFNYVTQKPVSWVLEIITLVTVIGSGRVERKLLLSLHIKCSLQAETLLQKEFLLFTKHWLLILIRVDKISIMQMSLRPQNFSLHRVTQWAVKAELELTCLTWRSGSGAAHTACFLFLYSHQAKNEFYFFLFLFKCSINKSRDLIHTLITIVSNTTLNTGDFYIF